uniref:RNA helicase n=1 Tax=Physcomitrium patens TaxID=3218 RepID=A0A7I4CTE9_PHYPA
MPPKKTKAKRAGKAGESSKGAKVAAAGNQGASRGAARVNLSSENEVRLRRLLLNSGGGSQSTPQAEESLTEGQRRQAVKRLKNIYDHLVAEGFTASQCETALSKLPLGGATLEAALDWLCLNLPPNELPSKFSSGVQVANPEGGQAQVLAVARPNWTYVEKKIEIPKDVPLIQKVQKPKKSENEVKAEQAEWIKRYMAEQAEDSEDEELESSEDDLNWEVWGDPGEQNRRKQQSAQDWPALQAADPEAKKKAAITRYQAAKHTASDAKAKGNKEGQAAAGRLIRELKSELAFLGLSEKDYDIPAQPKVRSFADAAASRNQSVPASWEVRELSASGKAEEDEFDENPSENIYADEMPAGKGANDLSKDDAESRKAKQIPVKEANIVQPAAKEKGAEPVEEGGGLLGMFDEEGPLDQSLPQSVVQIQKREMLTAWGSYGESPASKKVAASKKGGKSVPQVEQQRLPKAVLQQHCQKNGWPSPKYEKFPGQHSQFCYSVTVVQPTTGRGKNKIVGGPVTIRLPEEEDRFNSIAEAQNAVATRALFWLFPELPLYRNLPEPYRTMCMKWLADGQNAKTQDVEEQVGKRIAFVESLVNTSKSRDGSSSVGNKAAETPTEILNQQKEENVDRKDLKNEGSKAKKEAESVRLLRARKQQSQTKEYQAMLELRAGLPMSDLKSELLAKVESNEVVVVGGETGCGKTTQVPQYILDEMIAAGRGGFCNIVCTQPRRIAAISVAERVAVERCEPPPGNSGSLVGYQVRLDTAWHQGTKLLFCTTGILLRRLAGDSDLSHVSHVIVDEVHERTVLGDFLLVILKELLERRRESGFPLKLILMSATLDSNLFSNYFGDCPVISAKGRTFPVTTYFLEDVYEQLSNYKLATDSPAAMGNDYKANRKKASKRLVDNSRGRQDLVNSGWGDESKLEDVLVNPHYDPDLYRNFSERTRRNLERLNEDVIDYELLEDLIIYIDEEGEVGAVLVFLPGLAEIQLLWERLSVSRRFSGSASEWLIQLHSSVAPADQRRAFQRPPKGIRKIVLATNIAETSITIDDVVHVVDCGKHKENRFDPRRGMSSIIESWISQANAKQRRGRAGRVRSGNCFCLFTRNRLEKLMRPYQLPEMLRVPLVELGLQIKLLGLGNIAAFLEKALEPPQADAVTSAVSTLREVGAINEEEEITALGHHLAALPVDVRIGKMMLYGAVLGCVSPVLTVAACLSYKSPFVSPKDQREAAERAKQALVAERTDKSLPVSIASGQHSDHLCMVAAYNMWSHLSAVKGGKAAREFCHANFLSISTLIMLRDLRIQFASLLADIGFLTFSEGGKSKHDTGFEKWVDGMNQPFNLNSLQPSVVKAAICAGLYPNVAAMSKDSIQAGHASAQSRRAGLSPDQRPQWSDGRREVFIHPTSVNHMVSEFRQPFLVFHEKVETSKVYLRDTTVISPYDLLLFGGEISVQHQVESFSFIASYIIPCF